MKKYIILSILLVIFLLVNLADQIYDHEREIRALFDAMGK
jgi:hypothetical protein